MRLQNRQLRIVKHTSRHLDNRRKGRRLHASTLLLVYPSTAPFWEAEGASGCTFLCKTKPICAVFGPKMRVGWKNEANRSQFGRVGADPANPTSEARIPRQAQNSNAPNEESMQNKANYPCFWAGNAGWVEKQSQSKPISGLSGRWRKPLMGRRRAIEWAISEQ